MSLLSRATVGSTASLLAYAVALSCAGPDAARAGASPSDVPRSAFPSGEDGRVAWARGCLPDASMGLLLLPDLPYISSAPRPSPWWESVPHERAGLTFSDGGAEEYRSKDAAIPRVSALFSIRAERWEVDGRADDARFRSTVECVHRRLAAR